MADSGGQGLPALPARTGNRRGVVWSGFGFPAAYRTFPSHTVARKRDPPGALFAVEIPDGTNRSENSDGKPPRIPGRFYSVPLRRGEAAGRDRMADGVLYFLTLTPLKRPIFGRGPTMGAA